MHFTSPYLPQPRASMRDGVPGATEEAGLPGSIAPAEHRLRRGKVGHLVDVEERIERLDREVHFGQAVPGHPAIHLADAFLNQGAAQVIP